MDALHDFAGGIITTDQAMKLPTSFVDLKDVKDARDIVNANCSAAILHLQGLLFVTVTATDASGEVKRTRKKLDKLETETEYQDNSKLATKYPTPIIDKLLNPYLSNSLGGSNFNVW